MQTNKTNKPDTPERFLQQNSALSRSFLRKAFLYNYMAGLMIILQAGFLALIVNDAVFNHLGLSDVWPSLLGFACALYGRVLLTGTGGAFAVKAAATVKATLRQSLYQTLQRKGPLFVSGYGSGAIVGGLTDGVETIGKYYQDYLPAKALMSALPLTILFLVLPIDWLSGLIMIVTAPLIPVFMIVIGKGAESMNQKQWRRMARMGNHFLDAVQGLTTLKLFNAARREADAIAKSAEAYRQDTMAVLRVAFLSSVTLEFFATVSIAVVAVIIGFRLMWGEMDFLSGFFILLLAPEFYLPLRRLGAAYHARMESIGAAETILPILAEPYDESANCEQFAPLPDLKNARIQFDHVCQSYLPDRRALNDISFTIHPRQKVAVIGASGAGKSTLFSLLLRFIDPTTGRILINNTPLHSTDPQVWRQSIAWIPQHPTLFHGSVADNIRLGRQDATDQDIEELCEKLEIDGFIKSLPEGYHTHVGEKGFGLSGGQIQRIAVARAFLRDAPIILMDEPTASLDKDTEAVLQRAMNELGKDKTVITIAHRLHTIKQADMIVYLDNGTLRDIGTHETLQERHADYRALVQSTATTAPQEKEEVTA